MDEKRLFANICKKNGSEISEEQLDQLERFVAALRRWNQKINLISRKDEENIWKFHIYHCASLLFTLLIEHESKVIDIGTGGGLPGIPLKILRPDLQMTLLDSIEKKTIAVQSILSELSIPGVTVRRGRVEELGKSPKDSNRFHIAVARAVAPLRNLALWSKPILHARQNDEKETEQTAPRPKVIPPALIAMKGGDLTDELHQVGKVAGIRDVQTFNLPPYNAAQASNNDKKVVLITFR